MGDAEVAKCNAFAAPIPNVPVANKRLFVVLDGAAVFPHRMVSSAEATQRIAFAAPVIELACDLQMFFVVLDGAAVFAQRHVGRAEVAEVCTFCPSILQPYRGAQSVLSPADVLPGMLAQTKAMGARGRITVRQPRRLVIARGTDGYPGLSRLDISALQVKQGKP